MKYIIEEIYKEKSKNCKQVKKSAKYWDLSVEIEELQKQLEKELGEDKKQILDKLMAAADGQKKETALIYFKEGFKSGLLAGVEIKK